MLLVMSRRFSLGLRTRIAISLAAVLVLFIVLTEISVSSLVRVSLSRQDVESQATTESVHENKIEEELSRLRKPVLFYMITGALLVLLLGSIAITRIVVRPLGKITNAVELVADGQLDTEVPVYGSGELIHLGVSFNRMTRTLKVQQEELKQQLREIEKSSVELRETQDQLIRAARMASVGTLAAGVAHEIGNPITGILGLLDALNDDIDANSSLKYRALIRKEVERVDKIIANLLAYSRTSQNGQDAPSSASITGVLEHVQSLLRAQRLFDRIQLSVEADLDLPPIGMAEDDLTQLLINLLLNAGQAMKGNGAIRIQVGTIAHWKPALSVISRGAVRITVADSGPGIKPENVDQIFDPFYSNREEGQGTGLGLAISQSICNRAGAEIELDRDYADGARFIVTLPLAS